MSAWGIVPVVIFCVMLFVAVADPSIAERALELLGVALVAVLVAAFVEWSRPHRAERHDGARGGAYPEK